MVTGMRELVNGNWGLEAGNQGREALDGIYCWRLWYAWLPGLPDPVATWRSRYWLLFQLSERGYAGDYILCSIAGLFWRCAEGQDPDVVSLFQ